MPVFGFGAKNVVFGGMSLPWCAVAAIWSTVAGRSSTPTSASPDCTRCDDVSHAVLVGDLVVTERGPGGVKATRVEVVDPVEHSRTGPKQHEPVGPHERECAGIGHAAADRRCAVERPCLERLEPRIEGAEHVERRVEVGEEAVDRQHVELLGCELDEEGHDHLRRATGLVALVAIRERCRVAVVAIGDDDRRCGDGRADRVDHAGFAHPVEPMVHTVVVSPASDGRPRQLTQRAEPWGERQPPDRGEVRPA